MAASPRWGAQRWRWQGRQWWLAGSTGGGQCVGSAMPAGMAATVANIPVLPPPALAVAMKTAVMAIAGVRTTINNQLKAVTAMVTKTTTMTGTTMTMETKVTTVASGSGSSGSSGSRNRGGG